MPLSRLSRREFSRRFASLIAIPTAGSALAPRLLGATPRAQKSGEVSTDAESIHQIVTFAAPPTRVYEMLIEPALFSAMTRFSTVPKAAPARIARDVGGTFALFDGHITGRHIELVPAKRIVQAWRAGDWAEGVYSIARFELAAKGTETVLTFDHTGFPKGQGEHLAEGWHANYWTPLTKVLATGRR